MIWLIRSTRKEPEKTVEPVLGVSCNVRSLDGELVVEGRARTKEIADRLKRILDEMLDEILGGGDEA